MSPSVMICAGEASSDLHACDVISALRRRAPDVALFGMGGPGMRALGFEAAVRAEEVSVAGLTEVFWALPRLWGCLRRLERLAAARRPVAALLLDLPDFNLRLARRLKRLGIRVVYYISPQVWAWRQGRVKQIRAYVDAMLVILPFEEDFYRRRGIAARFVGHPLVQQHGRAPDAAARKAAREGLQLGAELCVAVLPGSRHKELQRHLPTMLAAMQQLHQRLQRPIQVLLPVAPTLDWEAVQRLLPPAVAGLSLRRLRGQACEALLAADVAVVCSGTATLQAALMGRPMVVVYKVSALTFVLLRLLVRLPHVALVNLIAGRRLVPELLQGNFTAAKVVNQLQALLPGSGLRHARLQTQLLQLRTQLGAQPTAELVAAAVMAAAPSEAHDSAVKAVI